MNSRVILLAALIIASAAPARSADLNTEGIQAYRSGDYSKAEQLYRQALAEEKDNDKLVAICRNLAVLFEAQGKDPSEFNKKADELSKSQTPRVLNNDSGLSEMTRTLIPGGSLREPNFVLPRTVRSSDAAPATPGNAQPSSGSPEQTVPLASPPIGVNFSNQSVTVDSSVGVNSPFGGFQRDSRQTYGLPPGSHGGYGTGYSVQTPNSTFQYSDGSPIILNAPDGRPVIIKAPGQNTIQTQQNPDGGTSTIINRTY